VKCNCNRVTVLLMKENKIELSNFQKHVRTFTCNRIEQMRKRFKEQQKLDSQQSSVNWMFSITVGLSVRTTQGVSYQQAASSLANYSSSVNYSSEYLIKRNSMIHSRKRDQASSYSY
jgi:hypothetical protein